MPRIAAEKPVFAFAFALFALLGFSSSASAAQHVIDQHDLRFVPASMTIAAGDTVRFTDTDNITHNVTIIDPDGSVHDMGMDRSGESIVVPFKKAGVYHVRCSIHPNMKATITVR